MHEKQLGSGRVLQNITGWTEGRLTDVENRSKWSLLIYLSAIVDFFAEADGLFQCASHSLASPSTKGSR